MAIKTLDAALYFNKEVITSLADISASLNFETLERDFERDFTGWTNMDCDKDFCIWVMDKD